MRKVQSLQSMASRANSIFSQATSADGDTITFNKSKFNVGDTVWIRGNKKTIWERAEVKATPENDEDTTLLVQPENGDPVLTRRVYGGEIMPNEDGKVGYSDMTSMRFVNEPQILENLRVRAIKDYPYTFLGPVLVAVNPMKDIEAKVKAGDRGAMGQAHPYAVAELAYNQMVFVLRRPDEAAESPSNQTIIVSGESGAGKTVSSKKVLDHLVARSGGGELAKAMLSSNPIMEAFGNARTLRNPNSSRFGKLLKVHYNNEGKEIVGASIGTYLLERSRITSHEIGERTYHVFYMLLAGADDGVLGELSLEKATQYGLLLHKSKSKKAPEVAFQDNDPKHYNDMVTAFKDVGVEEERFKSVLRVLAAVLHLSNIAFEDSESVDGVAANVTGATQKSLDAAAQLLGVDKVHLTKTFTELERKVGKDVTISPVSSANARQLLDGVAKALYSRLFTWTVNTINTHLSKISGVEELPTISVLDIFGFETFKKNDIEQLLINYTNESLQLTFNKQVLEAEAALYQREGLAMSDEDRVALDPTQVVDASNKRCIDLLQGIVTENAGKKTKKNRIPGVLSIIHEMGRVPKPTEKKMIDKLHKTFAGKDLYPNYMTIPKEANKKFIIKHYAGKVKYTVGSFLEKNNDTLPKSTDELFLGSTVETVKAVWDCGDKLGKGGRKKDSIVSKFVKQISGLSDDLNATQCSFIRCIKPNVLMKRKGDEWFDKRYTTIQLRNLSIAKTADVLKSGLPTRIPYSTLVESYSSVFAGSIKAPAADDERGTKAFIAALFFAFDISRSSYKLGLTRVFFKTGELEKLEEVLAAAEEWKSGNLDDHAEAEKTLVLERFKLFNIRRRWRVVFAYLFASRMFLKMHEEKKAEKKMRYESAVLIQKTFRGFIKRRWYLNKLEEKRLEEERKAREEAERIAKEKARLAEIARQKEIEAQKKRAQQVREFKEAKRRQRQLEKDRRAKMEQALRKANQEAVEQRKKQQEEDRKKELENLEKLRIAEEKAKEEEEQARKEREIAEQESAKQEKEKRIREEAEKRKANKLRYENLLKQRKAHSKSQQADLKTAYDQDGKFIRSKDVVEDKALVDDIVQNLMVEEEEEMAKMRENIVEEENEIIEYKLEEIEEEYDEHEITDAEAYLDQFDNDLADVDEYDSFGSDDEDEDPSQAAVSQVFTGGRGNAGNNVQYVGPFSAEVNVSKLEIKKNRLRGLNRSWKNCFMYYYPEHNTLLLHFGAVSSGNNTRRLEFNATDSSSPTILKSSNVYNKKQHAVYLNNMCVYYDVDKKQNDATAQKDLVMVFKSEERRDAFISVIENVVVPESKVSKKKYAEVDANATGTNMTIEEKKNRKVMRKGIMLNKLRMVKKALGTKVDQQTLINMLKQNEAEEEEEEIEEDLEEMDEWEMQFCEVCFESYNGAEATCPNGCAN